MLMLYAIGMLALRENSNDYIEVRIPDVNFTKRYTWKDNGFYEGGYNVVGKETYYIDFVTDNQFNGTSIESAWWIALNTDYKSCDCGIPSVMYFYNSELEYIIQTTADLIDLQPNYCVPMTCTWK
uniref:Uncharacterized protein n=1 Tax=Acrobeloides nanus TaxID=290746 RepID=A0A914D6I5_9BILA